MFYIFMYIIILYIGVKYLFSQLSIFYYIFIYLLG